MAGINKATIIGNLGKDPEVRYSQQGLAIVNFSIATSDSWTDKSSGEKKEKTEWHRIVVFGKVAENCGKYLKKGSQVYVEGKLQTSSYEKDGQTHYATDIIANTVQFLGGKKDGGGQQQGDKQQHQQQYSGQDQNARQAAGFGGQEPDDSIPF